MTEKEILMQKQSKMAEKEKNFKISVEKVQNRINVGHVVEWVEGRTT